MTMNTTIHPSILNCDIANLASELHSIRNADMVHVDVMDNHFVPNLTWGLPVVEACIAQNTLAVDAHLMIADADRHAPAYAEVGCRSVTFHLEACAAPVRLAREIRRLGSKAAVALRPATPIEPIVDILPEFDMVLVMTVEPGFGGQPFLDSMLPKIQRLRKAMNEQNLEIGIQVDGGIDSKTIERAAQAGANVFVAGSAVFKAEDAYAQVAELQQLAAKHFHA